MTRLCVGLLASCFGGFLLGQGTSAVGGDGVGEPPLRLGKFSVSLAVKDLAASQAFYEKLGFKVAGGEASQKWLILQNDSATLGLFQGMFSKNMLTFVPGWDRNDKALAEFDDIRDIQKTLKSRGVTFKTEADESSTGPASAMLADPDGNPILLDQYVPKPTK